MRIGNKFGNRYSGTLGKNVVASSWHGIGYLREYKVPMDPKSELQLQHRALFAKAVKAWHALDPCQIEMYDRAAVRMTGYDFFIREYIEAGRNGRKPNPREDSEDRPHTLASIFE